MSKTSKVNILVVVCIALAGIGVGIVIGILKTPAVASDTSQLLVETDSGQEETLKSKAKRNGGKHKEFRRRKNKKKFAGLKQLIAESESVVIGIPESNRSKLTKDGKNINLSYKIRVKYVYRGTLREGDVIEVSVPGGRWKFDDGSVAEVQTPWFKKMRNHRAYALFLNRKDADSDYVTTGESQGVFSIPTRRKAKKVISVHTGDPQYTNHKLHGMPVKAFLKSLRNITKTPLTKKTVKPK